MRIMTAVFLFALVATLPVVAQRGGDSDPDRAVTGGKFPAGWNVRPDRGTADQVKFTATGEVYHFAMGSAGTFYRSDWTKSGNYQFSARLTQKAAPSHPINAALLLKFPQRFCKSVRNYPRTAMRSTLECPRNSFGGFSISHPRATPQRPTLLLPRAPTRAIRKTHPVARGRRRG